MLGPRAVFLVTIGTFFVAPPADAQVAEWRGGGFLTSQSQACIDDGGYGTNNYASVRYRPRKLGDNGDYTQISFFHPLFFATSYRRKGNFTSSFKVVEGGGTGSRTWLFSNKNRLKATSTPSNIAVSTETVRLVGVIKNYGDTAGCKMAFDVSVTKRP